jgi:cysteinyl-tRNA synthetase
LTTRRLRGANAEGISLREYTDRYIASFHEDRKTLGITDADLYPRATEHIPEMVKMVEDLIAAKHAYVVDGSAYFKIESFPTYGQLARLNMEELQVGERVASDEYEKEDVRDFALWKNWEAEDGPVAWETSLGKGRPGWHLECSAMSLKYLGKGFDFHLGGVDLVFPHHQNEIAQTEGVTHEPLAHYWVHSEHLLVTARRCRSRWGTSTPFPICLRWVGNRARFAMVCCPATIGSARIFRQADLRVLSRRWRDLKRAR